MLFLESFMQMSHGGFKWAADIFLPLPASSSFTASVNKVTDIWNTSNWRSHFTVPNFSVSSQLSQMKSSINIVTYVECNYRRGLDW
jgi:hypothetical protein